jgi:trans-aconitate 2-methyltransferase
MPWDPDRYLRYEGQRSLAFHHLAAVIDDFDPAVAVDLGCGTGGLTASLADRWPTARITGIDSSEEMIERARKHAVPGQLEFMVADVARWQSTEPVDLMISNACFHWIDDHQALFGHLVPQLAPGGVFAFQVPANHDEPSHTVLRELCSSPGWRDRLDGLPRTGVREPQWYLDELGGRRLDVRAWQTTYFHSLEGENPVLEWMRGTTLRPVLERLPEDRHEDFLEVLGIALRESYPGRGGATVFPFTRTFVVAIRAQLSCDETEC